MPSTGITHTSLTTTTTTTTTIMETPQSLTNGNGKQRRASKIGPEQWEQLRPTVSDLYKKHTLAEVMIIMKEKHGFSAS